MKYNRSADPQRFKSLAVNVFGVDPAGKTDEAVGLEGIEALRASGLPSVRQARWGRTILTTARSRQWPIRRCDLVLWQLPQAA